MKFFQSLHNGVLLSLLLLMGLSSCGDSSKKETVLQGELTVYVDEAIHPLMLEQQAVFESQYPGRITIVAKPEAEIVNLMMQGKAPVTVLSRKLTDAEGAYFRNRKIVPKITPFAKDAVVVIAHKSVKDTVVDASELRGILQNRDSGIKGIVFENAGSGTLRYIDSLTANTKFDRSKVFSVGSHQKVLEYVASNPGMLGVVGLNRMLSPDNGTENLTKSVRVCAVRNVKTGMAYNPDQSNMGAGLYPFSRQLYVLNYQGSAGLGTGFASFVSGEIGQRIILKAGLLPIRIPGRNMIVRKNVTINN